ncbi:class GN sortase [Colwellia sp. E2M01]|uniref:class GN sortase n=1 Tax=Colwellia sp. E2M01 TaxID=2841561 RepID=UPI001C08BD30|nr:class GN sortase [Colwellia sp. E2M01]MBU2870057.1 class GN sortase [Colwellia sp. E2M01]
MKQVNQPTKARILLIGLVILACLLLIKPSYLYAKSVLAQLLLNHAWQKSLVQNGDNDHKYLPWQWADSYPVAKLSYIKGNDHSVKNWIILAGMTGRSMAFAPAWLEDSAKPNQYGNTVISAHNDSHFDVLESAELGDELVLEDRQGKQITYRVATIEIVAEQNSEPYLFQDETMLTLITCYPFTTTNTAKSQRLVIQAVAIETVF